MQSFDESFTFDLAPVSLWLEDLSAVRTLLEAWALQGMTSLRDHLYCNPTRVERFLASIKVLKVNRKTLNLYRADSLEHLLSNLHRVFGPETIGLMIDETSALWAGEREFFSKTVNYSLAGERLDIQLRGNILPGYEKSWGRVLVAVEDVTDLQTMRREVARSEAHARGMFEHSPVSLWVNDFSGVKLLFEELRRRDIHDLRVFIRRQPDFIERCADAIRILEVNRRTLKLYGLDDKTDDRVLKSNLRVDLREQLLALWDGALFQEREIVNNKADGTKIHIHLQFSVLPGHEHDWSLVQIARVDITARKTAEAHLEHLRNHDGLTGLHSRSFYIDELKRLTESGCALITVIIADLNGLKAANDRLGHAAGDTMLRRAGAMLARLNVPPLSVARIGGDEFVILMPGLEEQQTNQVMLQIDAMVREANLAHSEMPLSLSLGAATREANEPIETTVNRADLRMYQAKRQHYAQAEERRGRLQPVSS